MTNLDRMKLIMTVKDLEEAVKVYEKAKMENGWVRVGYAIPANCSKEAIKRRITQIRQDLLQLEIGL